MKQTYTFNGERMTLDDLEARLREIGLDASMLGINMDFDRRNDIDRINVIDYRKHPDNPNLFIPDPYSEHNRRYFPGIF